MNILLAFNSGYFIPARVLIHSVLLNNSCQVAFFIMHTSLTQEEMAILLADAQVSGHCSIHFVPVPETAFADAPLHLKWISKETYYRLLAQELLPEWVDRILYLDADMVVLRSLAEFYYNDFEGELLVACSTYTEKSISPSLAERFRQLTLPPDTLYFNAGVLLYDLAAQRKAIDPSIYHEYPVWFYRQLKYQDQDVLNAVFYRQVKLVSWRLYNAFEYSCEQEALGSWVDNNSVIFHFNGCGKPWTEKYWGKYSHLFWKYALDFPEYQALQEDLLPKQAAYQEERAQKQKEKAAKKQEESKNEG